MSLDSILLIGALVLLVAIGSSSLGSRFGLPALLLFLGIGMVPAMFGYRFDDPDLAHSLGFAALVIILSRAASPRSGETSADRSCWPPC